MSGRAALAAICLGCQGEGRAVSCHLCASCWDMLTAETRQRLRLRDAEAANRRFQLLSALRRRVPLGRIQVAA